MTYRSLGLLTLASLSLIGASRPLNPLVIRRATPAAVVVDCSSSSVPAVARATPAAVAVAPPTGTLRDALRDAQAALERNDRAAFDAALDRAREIAPDAPQLRVWNDIARVWDAQFESPFFASGSPAHAAASAYPGYEAAVRSEVLVDDAGQRFYPAAESRRFLAKVASSRLGSARRMPTRIRAESRVPSRPARRVSARASASRPAPSPAPPPAVVDAPPTSIVSAPTPPPVAPAPPPPVPTDTTPTQPAVIPPTPEPKRNLLLPLVVILVGIGMLVLLFRTKS